MDRFEGCQDINLDKSYYKSKEEFKIALSTLIMTLTKNDYEVLVTKDSEDGYIVRYSFNLNDPALLSSDDKMFFYATVDEIEEIGVRRNPRSEV